MVLLTCWLGNVLRATTACTLPISQLPKVVRTWGAFGFFTYKCASRHNGVQLFISHLASWLRTRRFSEPTFRPSWAPDHWKNTANRDFPTFSRTCTCIFFLLTLSLLSSSHFFGFSSLTLPTSAFPSVHNVGSFTSRLPSIMMVVVHTTQIIIEDSHQIYQTEAAPEAMASAPCSRTRSNPRNGPGHQRARNSDIGSYLVLCLPWFTMILPWIYNNFIMICRDLPSLLGFQLIEHDNVLFHTVRINFYHSSAFAGA